MLFQIVHVVQGVYFVCFYLSFGHKIHIVTTYKAVGRRFESPRGCQHETPETLRTGHFRGKGENLYVN